MAADEIDDRWLDIDFSKQPEFTFGCGGPGNLDLFGNYEDAVPTLSDSEIMAAVEKETAEGGGADRLVSRIYDQGREGSCVANACCQSHEIIQALQYGKENVVHLSAISLYKRIGRSPGSGAMVSDGLKELSTRGALPLDNAENREKYGDKVMPNTGFYTAYPADWENTASRLTLLETYVVRTVAGLKTALVLGHPVVVGREGHSIVLSRLMLRNGRLVAKYPNSWHERWGDNGFGYDSEAQIRKSASWAFAVRAVRREFA